MTPVAGWVHGCGGMGGRVPTGGRAGAVPVTVCAGAPRGRNPVWSKPFSPWHMRCHIGVLAGPRPARPRAHEGRLTRRMSWQQSARKDRPAEARAGHPGAAVGDGAVPGEAVGRAVRAAQAGPRPDAPVGRAGNAALAVPADRAAEARHAVRAPRGAWAQARRPAREFTVRRRDAGKRPVQAPRTRARHHARHRRARRESRRTARAPSRCVAPSSSTSAATAARAVRRRRAPISGSPPPTGSSR